MPERKVTHATFSIERTYDAPPAKVFAAFASIEAKSKWFAGPGEWQEGRRSMDFRVGGKEHLSAGKKGSLPHVFDAIYQDIVPNERIVYTYDMHIGENRISVSLATIEFKKAAKGTVCSSPSKAPSSTTSTTPRAARRARSSCWISWARC